jgi:uncharacterized protein
MERFFNYLKNPRYIRTDKIDWPFCFKLLLLYYLFSLPVGLVVGMFIKSMNFYETEFSYNTIKILFAGLFLSPIIEEMLFRLLLKPRFRNIILLFGFSIYMIIVSILKNNIKYLIIFSLIGIITLILCSNKRSLVKTQKLFLKHFNIVFYTSCFLFGLIHLTNYQPVSPKLLLSMPIIILPQVIGGSFMGYIRMKFGIKYSFLFHSITNVFPVLILIFDL